VVTAPLQGFLLQAEVRAGDLVETGQVLARLDDRDLRLERLKWIGEQTQAEQKYSQALARRDRTEALLLTSQIEQAQAQIALLDQQLARMTVTAPFSGVVVSGDLTQQLGAPVERGAVLFEVAPLDEYRVMLRVDERDITDVAVGQTGALVLAALPDAAFRVEVRRITPVSSTVEGANVFDVEAGVAEGPTALLRPGMEGVAKIEVDERRLVSIWTRRIVQWVRMTVWSWVP
jgi:multidrug resistance efflux pump